MIIDIAFFAETTENKNTILRSSELRNTTLEYCYNKVPGYRNVSAKTKRKIYDIVLQKLQLSMASIYI